MLAMVILLMLPGAAPPSAPALVVPTRAVALPGGVLVAEARGLRFLNTRLDLFHLFPTVERSDGTRTTLQVEADGTQGWQWVAITDSVDGLVGVLDWQVESSGPVVVVVTSADGRRWVEAARIEKPHYFGQIQGFVLEGRRVAGVRLLLDDCADCGVPVGRYVARRGQGGAWGAFTRLP